MHKSVKRELDQKKFIKYFFILAFLIIGGLMVLILTRINPSYYRHDIGYSLGIDIYLIICIPIVLILTAISVIFAVILYVDNFIDKRILKLIPTMTFVICVILGQIAFLFLLY